jgi:hypothetical protein
MDIVIRLVVPFNSDSEHFALFLQVLFDNLPLHLYEFESILQVLDLNLGLQRQIVPLLMVDIDVFFHKLIFELLDIYLILEVHVLELVSVNQIQISFFRVVELVFEIVFHYKYASMLMVTLFLSLSSLNWGFITLFHIFQWLNLCGLHLNDPSVFAFKVYHLFLFIFAFVFFGNKCISPIHFLIFKYSLFLNFGLPPPYSSLINLPLPFIIIHLLKHTFVIFILLEMTADLLFIEPLHSLQLQSQNAFTLILLNVIIGCYHILALFTMVH